MIALVDISDAPDRVAGLEQASRDIGFAYVTGHGIPATTIDRAREAVVAYFSLPVAQKERDCIQRDNYRGYIPLGFFSPNSGKGAADCYEGFKLHFDVAADDAICQDCDLYGPNKWPPLPANFRTHVLDYWRECDRVATVLLTAFAEILGQDPADFLQYFEYPLTNMTLLHYPARSCNADAIGIHPHKDTSVLTILAKDPVGGLQVRQRGGNEWIPVEPPGNALTVNIGDLLELWSGGYLVSTPHRVVNSTGADRYSFPYFVAPRYDTIVSPLRPAAAGFDRTPVHAGSASKDIWRSNWPDANAVDPDLDPGMLED